MRLSIDVINALRYHYLNDPEFSRPTNQGGLSKGNDKDRFWLNLQSRYDLEIERDRLGRRLEQEVEVLALDQSAPLT